MIVEEWPRGLRVKIPRGPRQNVSKRGKISQFSESSRQALGWVYSQGPWVSMLTLTYHENEIPPPDESKSHLAMVLQRLRRARIKYLWVLEWQKRGVPHYHVWMDRRFRDCPMTEDVHDRDSWRPIVDTWLNTTGQANDNAACIFHRHQKTYTDWEVRVGNNYAAKYADKICQKGLPDGVEGYGRWWGASHGVNVPQRVFETHEEPYLPDNEMTESVKTRRILRRAVEKWSGRKRKNRSSQTGFRYAARENRLAHLHAILAAYLPSYSNMTDSVIRRERARLQRKFDERHLIEKREPLGPENTKIIELGALSGRYIVRMSNDENPFTQKSSNGQLADDILSAWVHLYYKNETGIKLTDLGALRNAGSTINRVHYLMRSHGGTDQNVKNVLNHLSNLLDSGYIVLSPTAKKCVDDWTDLVLGIYKT